MCLCRSSKGRACWRRCCLSTTSCSSSLSMSSTEGAPPSSFTSAPGRRIEADLVACSGAWSERRTRCLWRSWGSEWRCAATAADASSTAPDGRHGCRCVGVIGKAWSVDCQFTLLSTQIQSDYCCCCFWMSRPGPFAYKSSRPVHACHCQAMPFACASLPLKAPSFTPSPTINPHTMGPIEITDAL